MSETMAETLSAIFQIALLLGMLVASIVCLLLGQEALAIFFALLLIILGLIFSMVEEG